MPFNVLSQWFGNGTSLFNPNGNLENMCYFFPSLLKFPTWVMSPHLVQEQLTEWRPTRYFSMFYVQNGGYQPQAQKELKWILFWLIFVHNDMEPQQYSTPTNGLILYTSLVQNEGPKIRMSTTTNSILYSPYLCSKKWRSLILYWCYLNTLLLSNVLKISQHKTRLNAAPPHTFFVTILVRCAWEGTKNEKKMIPVRNELCTVNLEWFGCVRNGLPNHQIQSLYKMGMADSTLICVQNGSSEGVPNEVHQPYCTNHLKAKIPCTKC